MRALFVIQTTILLILFGCNDKPDDYENLIQAECIVNELVCFPNDSISMEFELSILAEKKPYSIQWITPDTLKGSGPFTIDVVDDVRLEMIITDYEDQQFEFIHLIHKDTIDSLKYDYRDSYTGLYECEVHYNDYYSTPQFDTTYHDTLEISKDEIFTGLQIDPGITASVEFDFKSLTFNGYHTDGKFHDEDSVYYFYYGTPIALYTWVFNGKKIR